MRLIDERRGRAACVAASNGRAACGCSPRTSALPLLGAWSQPSRPGHSTARARRPGADHQLPDKSGEAVEDAAGRREPASRPDGPRTGTGTGSAGSPVSANPRTRASAVARPRWRNTAGAAATPSTVPLELAGTPIKVSSADPIPLTLPPVLAPPAVLERVPASQRGARTGHTWLAGRDSHGETPT